jgi:hypothetical protein
VRRVPNAIAKACHTSPALTACHTIAGRACWGSSARPRPEHLRAETLQVWLDARGVGFDRAAWAAAARDAVAAAPPRDARDAHVTIRRLLEGGPLSRDPYTRFVPPADMAALTRYDVSRAGLNLGTAAEFRAKVGPLPTSSSSGESGVWVLGLVRVRPARNPCSHRMPAYSDSSRRVLAIAPADLHAYARTVGVHFASGCTLQLECLHCRAA